MNRSTKLLQYQSDSGYRFDPFLTDREADSLFICLTFSGGGTRAAALAYGVMKKLRETLIQRDGATKRFLDEVDCISSVSGGSFPAAYYALFGDRLFSDFPDRFLYRNVELSLMERMLNPFNLVRLASPNFSRIDLAAELYDDLLFEGKTFATIIDRKRRPFVIVNATNMIDDERFEFTQEQFDFLGSELGEFPVARAVAASSAFPVLLTPVGLMNYGPPPGFTLPPEYDDAVKSREESPRRFQWARHQMRYLDVTAPHYVHLWDGGLTDNLGLRAIVNAVERSDGFINRRIKAGRIKQLVIVVVNARNESFERLGETAEAPGLWQMLRKAAEGHVENYSFETLETMKKLLKTLKEAHRNQGLRTCVIDVDFELIKDKNRRQYFFSLPTSFALSGRVIDELVEQAGVLLDESADFQRVIGAKMEGVSGENCS